MDDNPLTDAFFAGQSRHMLDYQGGEDSRDVWYRTERNKAEELLKSYRPGSCGEAMAAFGRGLHSAQDKISHRPWPGGSVGWRQFIPHPKWWDDYANLGSNEWYDQFWDKYADLHGTRGTDYDTWRGSDPQIASQLEKTDQVEADTWEKVQQFASLVKRYPCCASIALRER
ncbi:MAG: hypothetical protein NTW86_03035 [Candidatus Sumerlaeota bacterium]|nr:hypothetical protein [Candidatus Sumerlaeota bacterium]